MTPAFETLQQRLVATERQLTIAELDIQHHTARVAELTMELVRTREKLRRVTVERDVYGRVLDCRPRLEAVA